MTKTRGITTGKFEKNAINEDSVIARKNMIAVSDGAGGGGLFADRWSRYLLKHLPRLPITSAEQLDEWIGSIWEVYYNKTEESAKRLGGMALDKFYDEGSFATLAAVWKLPDNTCQWITYGDSVVFHYDYSTKELNHSFTNLADFSCPPYLINCKDELNMEGFRGGVFPFTEDSFVFVTSDALAHFILMMYELSRKEIFANEIEKALGTSSKNGNIMKKGMSLPSFKFETEVIAKLRNAVYSENRFKRWCTRLYKKGILAYDDYSLAVMYD
ncbi:MAG: hypothetical protein HDR88_00305 [Bacteroides sp.]|nr:hypothetical protein [Bacteroides sp.]